jgi:hypothetical protein
MENRKQPYIGNPWELNKGCKTPHVKPHKGMTPPKIDANIKRNDACFYCGKSRHYSRDSLKNEFDESKHRNRRHTGHFFDRGEPVNDDFQNIILFISNISL